MSPEIDATRVIADLRELDRRTGGPDGARRVCWTPVWADARAFLEELLDEIGVTPELDEAGNLWAYLEGEAEPALAVGWPTVAWTDCAFRVMGEISERSFASKIRQPILIIAAGADGIVSTPAIDEFSVRLRAGSHLIVPGARHELLMEQDRFRGQVLAAFDAFVPGTPLFG